RAVLRGGLTGWGLAGGVADRLPVYGAVPDFALTERSGRPVMAEALRGKVWIATFIFTRCSDTCPLQSAEMARLQGEFAAEEDLRLVSVTVDPEWDTPAVLARYATHFGAHPDRWLFLTGERATIHALAREAFRLGVVAPGPLPPSPVDEAFPSLPPSDGGGRGRATAAALPGPERALAKAGSGGPVILHSSRFVLVDRASRIRGYYETGDPESLRRLREHVRALLREA
ncbi:MAG: SCO family protein, partial [candidate division NC10 bacterium]|nr:SCO family protein [candidate division NC10 bacterium]